MTAKPTSAHLPQFSCQKVTDKLNETTGPSEKAVDNTQQIKHAVHRRLPTERSARQIKGRRCMLSLES